MTAVAAAAAAIGRRVCASPAPNNRGRVAGIVCWRRAIHSSLYVICTAVFDAGSMYFIDKLHLGPAVSDHLAVGCDWLLSADKIVEWCQCDTERRLRSRPRGSVRKAVNSELSEVRPPPARYRAASYVVYLRLWLIVVMAVQCSVHQKEALRRLNLRCQNVREFTITSAR